jgi:pimeloyl-ACP methyl ester carboxylesterase
VCAGWRAGQADEIENQPVISDVPTLVMAGEFDPVTPPAWGHHAAETLSRSYFFEYPGVGHGASAQECGREMMRAFWADPAVALDDRCIAEMR